MASVAEDVAARSVTGPVCSIQGVSAVGAAAILAEAGES